MTDESIRVRDRQISVRRIGHLKNIILRSHEWLLGDKEDWVSRLLTLLQHVNRVECYEEFLENYNQDPTRFLGCTVMRDGYITTIHSAKQEAKTRRIRSHNDHLLKLCSSRRFSTTINDVSGYVLLFGRNLRVMCCFFMTTHLFASPTSHN